jgi:hypothetical protein
LARLVASWRDLLISVPYRVAVGKPRGFLAGLAFERGSRWRSTQSRFESLLSHDGDDPFPFCVTIVTLEKFEDRVIVSYTQLIVIPHSQSVISSTTIEYIALASAKPRQCKSSPRQIGRRQTGQSLEVPCSNQSSRQS